MYKSVALLETYMWVLQFLLQKILITTTDIYTGDWQRTVVILCEILLLVCCYLYLISFFFYSSESEEELTHDRISIPPLDSDEEDCSSYKNSMNPSVS